MAIAALTAVAFGGLLTERTAGEERLVAASMIYLVATGGNLLVSYALIVTGKRLGLPAYSCCSNTPPSRPSSEMGVIYCR